MLEFYVNPKFIKRGEILDIYNLTPEGFGSNCYILTVGKRAIIIDPSARAERITSFLTEKGVQPEYIVLTHGHFDHISSLDTLRNATLAPAYIHKDDNEMLTDGEKNAYAFFFGYDKKWRPAERLLEDGDELTVGDEKLSIISTPGHSKGSICLLGEGFLITGDTLFANGYGRYDLHGGNAGQLAESLSKLREYDHDLMIYPGHGDPAKLGDALNNLMYF